MNNIILERIFQTIQVIRQSKDVSSALELLSETKVMGVRCIQRHNHDAITKTQQLNQIKCWLIKCSLAKLFYYRFPRQIRKSSLSWRFFFFIFYNTKTVTFVLPFQPGQSKIRAVVRLKNLVRAHPRTLNKFGAKRQKNADFWYDFTSFVLTTRQRGRGWGRQVTRWFVH